MGIQELDPLQNKRDFQIVWYLAMIHMNQRCKYKGTFLLKDNEVLEALSAKFTISTENAQLTEKTYILAGLFSWHTNNPKQAKEYIQKAYQLNPSSVNANVCLGWLELDAKKNTMYFDNALEKSMRDIEGVFGKCISKKNTGNHSEALELANRLIAYHPTFIPAYVERLKILLEIQNWELLLEGAQRLGGISNDNIDALNMICIHELCFEGPSPTVATFISTLQKVIFK